MAQSVSLVVSAGDRARLEAIVADRNRPQRHVARARLVLLSADRLDVAAIARRAGISRPAVWRWQRRYAEAGVDGLLRDKTRKPGKAPLGDGLVRRLVALTCAEPPGEVTHWTGRAMAEAAGVSLRSVQRVWAAHERTCREFRVWAGMIGAKEPRHAATQRAKDTRRHPRPAAGRRRSEDGVRPERPTRWPEEGLGRAGAERRDGPPPHRRGRNRQQPQRLWPEERPH